jgi:hypothetical protein
VGKTRNRGGAGRAAFGVKASVQLLGCDGRGPGQGGGIPRAGGRRHHASCPAKQRRPVTVCACGQAGPGVHDARAAARPARAAARWRGRRRGWARCAVSKPGLLERHWEGPSGRHAWGDIGRGRRAGTLGETLGGPAPGTRGGRPPNRRMRIPSTEHTASSTHHSGMAAWRRRRRRRRRRTSRAGGAPARGAGGRAGGRGAGEGRGGRLWRGAGGGALEGSRGRGGPWRAPAGGGALEGSRGRGASGLRAWPGAGQGRVSTPTGGGEQACRGVARGGLAANLTDRPAPRSSRRLTGGQ